MLTKKGYASRLRGEKCPDAFNHCLRSARLCLLLRTRTTLCSVLYSQQQVRYMNTLQVAKKTHLHLKRSTSKPYKHVTIGRCLISEYHLHLKRSASKPYKHANNRKLYPNSQPIPSTPFTDLLSTSPPFAFPPSSRTRKKKRQQKSLLKPQIT